MSLNNHNPIATIGVLLGTLEEPCQSQILSGLAQFSKTQNIHLLTFVGATINCTHQYLHNYDLLTSLMKASQLDVLIMMTGAMSSVLTPEEIALFTEEYKDIPIISISTPLPGCTNILIDNYSGMMGIMEHLITIHHCQKLAFVCGPTGHDEADARLHSFKESLSKYNIPLDSRLILPGNFSMSSGEDAVQTLWDDYGIHPDAIVCVDDSTACGVVNALKKRNISVPSSVLVTGFDDSLDAKTCMPPLTTVNQPFYDLGVKAGQMSLKLLKENPTPTTLYIPTHTVIRESCGCSEFIHLDPSISHEFSNYINSCIDSQKGAMEFILSYILSSCTLSSSTVQELKDILSFIFMNIHLDEQVMSSSFWTKIRSTLFSFSFQGIRIDTLNTFISLLIYCYEKYMYTDNTYKTKYICQSFNSLLNDLEQALAKSESREDYLYNFRLRQTTQKLIASFNKELMFDVIEEGLKELGIHQCFLVLLENEDSDLEIPHLVFGYVHDTRLPDELLKPFNSSYLLPNAHLLATPGASHLILPLLPTQDRFGYMICEYNTLDHSVFETLRSHIGSGLSSALLYEKEQIAQSTLNDLLLQTNCTLKSTAERDELTSLYNRRGFMDISSTFFEAIHKEKQDGILFFMDLDALKLINDRYGHLEGDTAIIQTAQILLEVFDSIGYVGRIGGDEFTAFIPYYSGEMIPIFRSKLMHLFNHYNATSGKPYQLSISIGTATHKNNPDVSFRELLNISDMELYLEKQTKYKKAKLMP